MTISTNKKLPYDAVMEYHRNGVGGEGYYTIALDTPKHSQDSRFEDGETPDRMLAIVPSVAVTDEDGELLAPDTHIPEILVIDPNEVAAFANKRYDHVDERLLNWRGANNFSYEVMEIIHAYAPDSKNPEH